jgi:hypothetical protein
MSTVPEILVAKACGMEVFGLSLVTNLGAGLSKTKLSHNDVMEAAEKSKTLFREIKDFRKVKHEGENKLIRKIKYRPFPLKNIIGIVNESANFVKQNLGQCNGIMVVHYYWEHANLVVDYCSKRT